MGYLDKDGLAYLWQKIKTALAGKQDTITPGDGLSKDGNTLNVDNPVRGVYTQVEFDALTDAKKASGTYFVDDGQGGGFKCMKIYSNGKTLEVPSCASQHIYSTEEQVVGRWIDGRPVYERTIIFQNVAISYNGAALVDTDSTVDSQVYGWWSAKNGNGDGFSGGCVGVYTGGRIHLINNIIGTNTFTGHAVIAYTKTTDQATIELPAALTAAPAQALYKAAPQSAAAVTLDVGGGETVKTSRLMSCTAAVRRFSL